MNELTARERQVLLLVLEGKLDKEIAAELGIRHGTVRAMVSAIFKKANVRNRAELVRYVARLELLDAAAPLLSYLDRMGGSRADS